MCHRRGLKSWTDPNGIIDGTRASALWPKLIQYLSSVRFETLISRMFVCTALLNLWKFHSCCLETNDALFFSLTNFLHDPPTRRRSKTILSRLDSLGEMWGCRSDNFFASSSICPFTVPSWWWRQTQTRRGGRRDDWWISQREMYRVTI